MPGRPKGSKNKTTIFKEKINMEEYEYLKKNLQLQNDIHKIENENEVLVRDNKLLKAENEQLVNENANLKKYRCCYKECDTILYDSPSAFYTSQSDLYANNNKRLPICKFCLNKMYNKYFKIYKNKSEAIIRVCAAWDMYVNQSLLQSIEQLKDDDETTMGKYIKNLNMVQFNGRTYDTYLEELSKRKEVITIVKEEENETNNAPKKRGRPKSKPMKPITEIEVHPDSVNVVTQAQLDFWGNGFTPEMYDGMDKRYKEYQPLVNDEDIAQVQIVKDLVRVEQVGLQALRDNDYATYKNMQDMVIKLRKEVQFKPKEEVKISLQPIDKYISDIEQYAPAEIHHQFLSDYIKRHKDENYLERFILRPLRNLLTGKKEMDEEYSIKPQDLE